MYWALAAAFLLIALAVPRLRPVGIVGSVVLALMLGWGMIQRIKNQDPTGGNTVTRGKPSAPGALLSPIPLESVNVSELRLSGNGAPFEVRGVVRNNAPDKRLKSITLEITRKDCFPGALEPGGCVTILQNEQWIEIVVPPQQERLFDAAFWARGAVARARGTIKDDFRLVSATGETPR